MKKLLAAILLLSLSLPFIRCKGPDTRLRPFRWEAVDPEFDSLTIAFDYATWQGEGPDSLGSLARRAEAMAKNDPGNTLKTSRAHFFRGVTLMKQRRGGEADSALLTARALLDSASHPYEVARIDFWLVGARAQRRGVEAYNRTMEKIRFYEEIGDSALLAMQYGDLGILLKKYGDLEEACKDLATATRLFNSAGLKKQARGNTINTASCLERMGRNDEAAAILRELTADPAFRNNMAAYPTTLLNLYYWAGDTAALREATALILSSDLAINRRSRGRVLAENSQLLRQRGSLDSAFACSLRAMEEIGGSYSDDSAFILLNHSEILRLRGDNEGALESLSKWREITERLNDERVFEQVHALTASRLVAEARAKTELEHTRRMMFWIALSLSLLVILAVLAAIYLRERNRHELRQVKAELEKGTLQRKIMSMQIATKDNDSFLYTFASINPNFTQRLKEKYPALSPMDLKLAAFAVLKLDIKQVARILGIKPESVKQSRWRLRRKLGLGPEEDLNEALRPYLDEVPE